MSSYRAITEYKIITYGELVEYSGVSYAHPSTYLW